MSASTPPVDPVDPVDPRAVLAGLPPLPPAAAAALTDLVAAVLAAPSSLPRHFAAAGRRVGRGPLPAGAAPSPGGAARRDALAPGPAAVEDVARVALLVAARGVLDDAALLVAVEELYHHGDGDERRAVLHALPALGLGDTALPLVRDALRTNDVRLVAAAMGPYAAAHLDDAAWRHGVLKCLFTGIPLAAVHGLDRRTDAELVRMVAAFADERTAAGRGVPPDARRLLDRSPPGP